MRRRKRAACYRPDGRHAQVHLPAMDPHEALLVADVFERISRAIWRTHGNGMADHLAMLGIETPPPTDAVTSSDPAPDDSNEEVSF